MNYQDISSPQLPLPQDMVVEPAPCLSMCHPNALLLKDQHSSEPVYLAFESREERQHWMDSIMQVILDLQVWGASACDHTIPVPSSKFYVESPSKDLYPLPSITNPHKEPPTSTVRTHIWLSVTSFHGSSHLQSLQWGNTEEEGLGDLVTYGDIR